MNPLPVPRAADSNIESIEVLRLWKVPEIGQQVILRHDALEDPRRVGTRARRYRATRGAHALKKDTTKKKCFNASSLAFAPRLDRRLILREQNSSTNRQSIA